MAKEIVFFRYNVALSRISALAVILLALSAGARASFWSLKDEPPETVKLVRRLPPVAVRNGKTVKFDPSTAGPSIPAEVATVLREKIRTLLLQARDGGIRLVETKEDTILKCIVNSYEPRVERDNVREIGNQRLALKTLIGNIEASVQVLDSNGDPLDAAILKHHMENDYVNGQQTMQSSSAGSWVRNPKELFSNVLGGPKKTARIPTPQEWSSLLAEGLAYTVANRIVPVDEEFSVNLPRDRELDQARLYAKSNRWGDAQENLEKMEKLKGAADAYRLYMLGLTYEAIAYQGGKSNADAAELLNKASDVYDQASQLKPSEREILLQQIRVRDSIDHYLQIQQYLRNRQDAQRQKEQETKLKTPAPAPPPSPPEPPKQAPVETADAENNASLIEMAASGMPESVMLKYVRDSKDPKFDASVKGLLQMQRAKVPPKVIEVVQERMSPPASPSQVPQHPRPKAQRPVPKP